MVKLTRRAALAGLAAIPTLNSLGISAQSASGSATLNLFLHGTMIFVVQAKGLLVLVPDMGQDHVYRAGNPPIPPPAFGPDAYTLTIVNNINALKPKMLGAATNMVGPQTIADNAKPFCRFILPFPDSVVPFRVFGPPKSGTPFFKWGPKGGTLGNSAQYSTDQVLFQYSYAPNTPPQLKGSGSKGIAFNPAQPLHIHCEMDHKFTKSTDPVSHLQKLSDQVSALFARFSIAYNPLPLSQFTAPNLTTDGNAATKLGLDPKTCGPLSSHVGPFDPPDSGCGGDIIVG